MSDHSIKRSYEIRMSSDARAVIISAANKEDPLKYDYYMLLTGSDNKLSVKRIDNPILLARNSGFNIHRIVQGSDAYNHFANRFASYYAAPKETAKKLHFKESIVSPKLAKRNQLKNRT